MLLVFFVCFFFFFLCKNIDFGKYIDLYIFQIVTENPCLAGLAQDTDSLQR